MGVAASLAVLPFENPTGDPEQGYVARGFVEELITELSRFPTIEVIHPHTSAALAADRLPDDLGVAYLLRGSVRRLGEIVRIAAQLIEAAGGRQIWADRFDAPADQLLAVQDESRGWPARCRSRSTRRGCAAPGASRCRASTSTPAGCAGSTACAAARSRTTPAPGPSSSAP